MNVSLIDGHIDSQALYIVYDAEGASEPPVFGVFTSMDKAIEGCKEIVETLVKECLAEDPKESGLDKEYDEAWLRKDCLRSLGIQVHDLGLDKVSYISTIELPEEYM